MNICGTKWSEKTSSMLGLWGCLTYSLAGEKDATLLIGWDTDRWFNSINKDFLVMGQENVTLEGTAVWAGYSKNYLCRLLKNGTWKTFSEILNSIRVQKACEYLVHTDMPAAEIAESVGYTSIKHFYRVFREIMGCTPGQYRGKHG